MCYFHFLFLLSRPLLEAPSSTLGGGSYNLSMTFTLKQVITAIVFFKILFLCCDKTPTVLQPMDSSHVLGLCIGGYNSLELLIV
ncbi:hypothetical protein GDO78_010561 [Eleutherodactylus coqui]|uniref:Secreted protein n=1 Tax=Eleutherodactylus coqui TaxID=57060 RepID=A0A8J6K5A6_ELECQ|nr:hypothetical protein GDO78_010561 [Eleutherodactylus coqui]